MYPLGRKIRKRKRSSPVTDEDSIEKDSESIGWSAPAAMHSYDALLLFFEEMRVGGILEDMQLVRIEPTYTPGYTRGHVLTYWQRTTGTQHQFNTGDFVNPQTSDDFSSEPMTYADAVQRLKNMMADSVRWGKSHGAESPQ